MKILLTGAAGQLGQELYPRLAHFASVTAADLNPDAVDSFDCKPLDLADHEALNRFLSVHDPDILVNAAAFTAVDLAQERRDLAFEINAHAPGRMATWAASRDRGMVHYSTDYVFDGIKRQPYLETDPTRPLNVYGESKLAGEQAVVASQCRHLVMRSAWIYSSHGSNFVLKMLELARQGRDLKVVGDQIGSPTWAGNLAHYTVQIINSGVLNRASGESNIFHCADRGQVSWFEFARQVFTAAVGIGLLETMPALSEVDSSQFAQKAKRPQWSVLDSGEMQSRLGIMPLDFQDSLLECLNELVKKD